MQQLKDGGIIIDYRFLYIYVGTSSKLFVIGDKLLSAILLYNRLSGVPTIVVIATVHMSRSVHVQITEGSCNNRGIIGEHSELLGLEIRCHIIYNR